MPTPILGGLPPNLTLAAGYQVRLNALDQTTGNAVSGVKVTGVSIFVTNLGPGPASRLSNGPFMLLTGPGE